MSYFFIFPVLFLNLLLTESSVFSIELQNKNFDIAQNIQTNNVQQRNNNRNTYRKQTVKESLDKLNEYFPINYEINNPFDVLEIKNIFYQSQYDYNSIFSDFAAQIALYENMISWLGTPYRYAGRSSRGVDCSNFVSLMIKDATGITIPAGSANQSRLVKRIDKIEELQYGDLIFFTGRNRNSSRIGHVGIYFGNGLFAHSSTGRGVILTHISEGYYQVRYRFGGRLIIPEKV